MAINFLTNIDLNQNQIIEPVIHNETSAPSPASGGQMYYNSTNGNLYVYDDVGTAWVDLTSQGSGATNLGYTSSATNGIVTSSTGTDATLILVTPSTGTNLAGLMSPADKTKLDGIASGAEVNVGTNLGNTASGTALTVTSSTGSNTNLPAATTTTWGVMTDEDKTKLDGIAAGAQVNVGTNLGNSATGTSLTVTSSTGTDTNLPAATTSTWGVMTDEDKTKLDGLDIPAIISNGTIPSLNTGITVAEIQQLLNLEVGVDIDPINTDNSTDVTLANSPATYDYLTISGQEITLNQIDLTTDVTGVLPIANFSSLDDDTFATASTTTVPTSESVKAYVDSKVAGGLIYQGNYDASGNPPTGSSVLKGYTYTVTVAGSGTGGTFWSTPLAIGDMIIAEIDNPTVEANWTAVNKNIPDIVSASTTAQGIVELATAGEVTTGTDATRAITPAALESGFNGSSNITTLGTISTGTWQGTAIGDTYISSASTWNAKLDSAGVIALNDYAKFDGNGDLIGRSYTEVKQDLSLDAVENTALSTWTGSANITTLGTITSGTWNGSVIAEAYLQNQSGTNTGDEVPATTSVAGVVQLATTANTIIGTQTGTAVTPAGLSATKVTSSITIASLDSVKRAAEINHALGTEDISVELYDDSTGATVYADVLRGDFAGANTTTYVTIVFGIVPSAITTVNVVVHSHRNGTAKTASYPV